VYTVDVMRRARLIDEATRSGVCGPDRIVPQSRCLAMRQPMARAGQIPGICVSVIPDVSAAGCGILLDAARVPEMPLNFLHQDCAQRRVCVTADMWQARNISLIVPGRNAGVVFAYT
jgi:hypothetical protein